MESPEREVPQSCEEGEKRKVEERFELMSLNSSSGWYFI